jgi:hypothetical protein
MIVRLAIRSLTTRPLRSAVLAAGFGLGIGVMVELLGVGQVILEQAHSPALQGGGDVVVGGTFGPLDSARFLLSHVFTSNRLRHQVAAASPNRRATVFLIKPGLAIAVSTHGGVPSLEKAVGDPEVSRRAEWRDAPPDRAWTNPADGEILRAMDRFHRVPTTSHQPPATSSQPSAFARGDSARASAGKPAASGWAEWLYFNGRSVDGRLRFYLSFIAGAPNRSGTRPITARLQLERDGQSTNYSAVSEVDDRELLARAPDLDVGENHVRLEGTQYRITLALLGEKTAEPARGTLTLDAPPGRSLPPAAIHGAGGWVSGYVVPVLSGTFNGRIQIGAETIAIENAPGYHDHNWGFWEGVHWQWGQVASGDLSIVYGRVFPPASIADPQRVPGFLGLLGRDGPMAFSTDVTITEEDDGGVPRAIHVRARGEETDLALDFTSAEHVRTSAFVQLGGIYEVRGRAAGRDISFTARGSAETFRPNEAGLGTRD